MWCQRADAAANYVAGTSPILASLRALWPSRFTSSRRYQAFISLLKLILSSGRIHHPFLLADNRHYTFYVWRRVFRLHPFVPYTLIPGYIACAWAWYLRIGTPSHKCLQCFALTRTLAGQDQTLLQTLLLPVFVTPTLLPTPLLEPRYFLIPYILLRAQVNDVPWWGVALEGVWYAAINAATMWVFLYKERVGVGRFMW